MEATVPALQIQQKMSLHFPILLGAVLRALTKTTIHHHNQNHPLNRQKRNKRVRMGRQTKLMVFVMSVPDSDGEPNSLPGVHAKWRNRCGQISREKCEITWEYWRSVNGKHKEFLWACLQLHIRFPLDCDLEKDKKDSIQAIGRELRNFKARLVVNYVRKNRILFKKFGNISTATWAEFIRQKTHISSCP